MKKHTCIIALVILCSALSAFADTQPEAGSGDAAAEMARKLNNPLANIKALMTDNAIGFNIVKQNGNGAWARSFPSAPPRTRL